MGGRLLGWRTVCAVELDAYARRVLLARQRDGHLDRFPIWDDVCTFDGEAWRGHIQVLSGGFPCQDVASCGKGAGLSGSQSGLWKEMARIIREVGPQYVFVENSPMLAFRGLDVVLGDLASMGYDARWGVLGARHVGAPHRRNRIWIAARYADGQGQPIKSVDDEVERVPRMGGAGWKSWGRSEPEMGGMVDGVAHRVDRMRAIGNGQVPAVAALAWKTLTKGWL